MIQTLTNEQLKHVRGGDGDPPPPTPEDKERVLIVEDDEKMAK